MVGDEQLGGVPVNPEEWPSHARDLVERIWDVAAFVRGDVRTRELERLLLPLVLLRRLECLEDTRGSVGSVTLAALRYEPAGIAELSRHRDPVVASVLEDLGFDRAVRALPNDAAYALISSFSGLDLSAAAAPPDAMTAVIQELVRRTRQTPDLGAQDSSTPPDVARLLVELLFADITSEQAQRVRVLDPACGTGGLLIAANQHVRARWGSRVETFGEDISNEAAAIGRLIALAAPNPDMHISVGNSLVAPTATAQVDFGICHPPFGASWKNIHEAVSEEHRRYRSGRYSAGLPRASDSQLLFVQHLLDAVAARGGRVALVLSGAPLFSGEAGSGESEIRRHLIERDLLECVVALPPNLFFNTAIPAYVWLLSCRKSPHRRRKVQFINAATWFDQLQRNSGSRARTIGDGHRARIVDAYVTGADDGTLSRIVDVEELGYRRLTVERPLRLRFEITQRGKQQVLHAHPRLLQLVQALDREMGAAPRDWTDAWPMIRSLADDLGLAMTQPERRALRDVFAERDPDGEPVPSEGRDAWEADPELRDQERVALTEDTQRYLQREVLPYVQDAWISEERVGYDFALNRLFVEEVAQPRSLHAIDEDVRTVRDQLDELLNELLT